MKPQIAVTAGPDDLKRDRPFEKYRLAVERAGGEPVPVGNLPRGDVAKVLAKYDGLVIPGGPDIDPSTYGGRPHPAVQASHPDRDSLELEAARYAKRSGLPTLAICRGMQVVNVALGGTLYEDIDDQFEASNGLKLRHRQTPDWSRTETTHHVDVVANSRLASIVGASAVATNTLHHQAVRRIAHDLEPVARARDGIVEALELRGEHPFFLAVQWHPEELIDADEPSRRLFARFVEAARRRASGRLTSAAAQ